MCGGLRVESVRGLASPLIEDSRHADHRIRLRQRTDGFGRAIGEYATILPVDGIPVNNDSPIVKIHNPVVEYTGPGV